MTFTELQTEVLDRLNFTSSAASTRVGRAINRLYREIGTSIGMSFARQTNTSETVTIGNPEVVFSGTEKILQVWTIDGDGGVTVLDEVLLATLREAVAPSSDEPKKWALRSTTSNSVTIRLDKSPATAYTIYAEVIAEVTDLSGSNEPSFPESFHDILVEGVLKDEYRKLEKVALARESEATFQRRLSDLRMFVAKSNMMLIRQGEHGKSEYARLGTGGTASLGTTPLTITAAWAFNRDPLAPFTVSSGSAVVTNLDADLLDGSHGTEYAKLADNETVSGTWTHTNALTLTNGQLVFPATQVPSTGANTLDDYEEGNANSISFGGSGGQSGQVYSLQVGRYIKIGKNVFVYGRITLSTLGTITGDVEIQNLPFTAENVSDGFAPINIGFFAGMTSSFVELGGYVVPNSTKATLTGLTAAGTGTGSLAQADLSNTTSIIFSATYRASA